MLQAYDPDEYDAVPVVVGKTTAEINFRSDSSLGDNVIGKLEEDTIVIGTSISYDEKWTSVMVIDDSGNLQEGWISSSYFTTYPPSQEDL